MRTCEACLGTKVQSRWTSATCHAHRQCPWCAGEDGEPTGLMSAKRAAKHKRWQRMSRGCAAAQWTGGSGS
jgi:hypothetical protein